MKLQKTIIIFGLTAAYFFVLFNFVLPESNEVKEKVQPGSEVQSSENDLAVSGEPYELLPSERNPSSSADPSLGGILIASRQLFIAIGSFIMAIQIDLWNSAPESGRCVIGLLMVFGAFLSLLGIFSIRSWLGFWRRIFY
jgi:hypothetical protein